MKGSRARLQRLGGEGIMASFAAGVEARCPLCGSSIISIGRGGRVEVEDLHAIPISRTRMTGEGYLLCEDCAVLALYPDLSLN